MAYCEEVDLLIGDGVFLPDTLDKTREIANVADDMDAKLGFIYTLPLSPLLPHEEKLLKSINAKMASGRILLRLYSDGEASTLHAYGLKLVTEAENDLMLIANGLVELGATPNNPPTAANRGPTITNRDEESAVEQFENLVHRGEPSFWRPGAV